MKYYYYWLAVFVFVVDYLSKKWIEHSVTLGEQKHVIGDFFVITSVRNKGAAFSILQNQRLFFVAITIVVVVGIIWYILKIRNSGRALLLAGLGMVLGGALGNFLERALYGQVVDFLQFTFGSYVFPIFNLADSGIFVGVVLILLDAFITSKKENGDSNDRKERDGQDELNGQQGTQFIQ
ncbi:signal peptidase II [Paenibacillus taihuensis]|uniref:Lipoprotein signal peptidase n=1 Tax=Paenibacillus taihuensis TaxID=1156355 RepID=A0A3D9SI45_9BACL|nr:signal peptidase II [Paenibacillus taihuensis]REE92960.1 signal peptidase II [Paenibacillus taihuensis]